MEGSWFEVLGFLVLKSRSCLALRELSVLIAKFWWIFEPQQLLSCCLFLANLSLRAKQLSNL